MEWKLKEDPEVQSSSETFFYALNNGYICPDEVLDDPEQLNKLYEALALINSFEDFLTENDLLEEM